MKTLLASLIILLTLVGCAKDHFPTSPQQDSVEIFSKNNGDVVKTFHKVYVVHIDMDGVYIIIKKLNPEAGRLEEVYRCERKYFSWRWVKPKDTKKKRRR